MFSFFFSFVPSLSDTLRSTLCTTLSNPHTTIQRRKKKKRERNSWSTTPVAACYLHTDPIRQRELCAKAQGSHTQTHNGKKKKRRRNKKKEGALKSNAVLATENKHRKQNDKCFPFFFTKKKKGRQALGSGFIYMCVFTQQLKPIKFDQRKKKDARNQKQGAKTVSFILFSFACVYLFITPGDGTTLLVLLLLIAVGLMAFSFFPLLTHSDPLHMRRQPSVVHWLTFCFCRTLLFVST